MPTLTINKDRKDRKHIERWRLVFWVQQAIKKYALRYAVIEQVASSPQMGVASSFKFGQGYGEVLGVLEALGLIVHFVHPALWKPHMGLSRDKSQSKSKYRDLFNQEVVGGDGPAEAALIAHFFQRELYASKRDVMR